MNQNDSEHTPSHVQADEIVLRDRQAATYDDWILKTKGRYFDLVDRRMPLKWLRLQKSHRVLDAGAGTGRFAVPIAQRCNEVWAVDFSAKSLEVLREKAAKLGLKNLKTLVGDLVQVGLPRKYFDRVLSNSVIHHIPTAGDRLAAVRCLHDALKEGGMAAIMTYRWGGAITFQKEYWTETEGGRLFRMGFVAQELSDLMRQAGFQRVKVGGLFNFKPRGLSRLPWLIAPYALVDGILTNLSWSASRGKHLLALGTK